MKFCDRASGLGGPDKEKGPFVIGEGLTRKRHMFVSCARADSYFSSDKKKKEDKYDNKKEWKEELLGGRGNNKEDCVLREDRQDTVVG